LIREEIGRNYHTIDNDPYSYEDYPGITIDIYPVALGNAYEAQVTCEFDESLSTPKRMFPTEEDAKHFVRQHAEQIHRNQLGRNIEI
jgi:hypothetical protein